MSDSVTATDCSPLVSSVHGILQARILESVVIFSSRGSSRPRGQIHVSLCGFFTTSATWEAHLPNTRLKHKYTAQLKVERCWRTKINLMQLYWYQTKQTSGKKKKKCDRPWEGFHKFLRILSLHSPKNSQENWVRINNKWIFFFLLSKYN